jgi:hypothetical protein
MKFLLLNLSRYSENVSCGRYWQSFLTFAILREHVGLQGVRYEII